MNAIIDKKTSGSYDRFEHSERAYGGYQSENHKQENDSDVLNDSMRRERGGEGNANEIAENYS